MVQKPPETSIPASLVLIWMGHQLEVQCPHHWSTSQAPPLGLGWGLLARGRTTGVACGEVECAGGRENETTPGRQAMNDAGSVVTLLSNF